MLKKAIQFAKSVHRGTRRKSGAPFITHPIAVMSTLKEAGFGETVLVAAVLHDVLEEARDRKKNEQFVHDEFGDEVYFLVTAVSKDFSVRDKTERDKAYHEQLILAMSRDSSVLFIKMADLLHNVSTVEHLSKKKQNEWVGELKRYYLFHFLENFHVVPHDKRELYLDMINKMEEVVEEYQSGG
jgi:GTP diphosphokinase / guanosine-3',5'-bis(diphosphate) 3'-diphosphatase